MTEPLRLRTVLAQCLHDYCQGHSLNPRQWQVCHHVLACRTEALGETHLQCDHCAQEARFYHACRDRHCPRCQRQAFQQWSARQSAQILDVVYYHVVFTLPQAINPWSELHPEAIYDQLFKSAWETLRRFVAAPKRLDGQLGATLVLHTWGQTLTRHLHVHALVPGGALTEQGTWNAARSTYLFPVRALSRYFRGHFVRSLRERYDSGELARIHDPKALKSMLDALMQKDWVVYSKPCLEHTDTLVSYLARYSHRIALSDSRLVDFHDAHVQLRYKDYRDHGRHKVLRLSAEELIRRFLLHVLPKHFVRIRRCGFLANRCRETEPAAAEPTRYRCPHCGERRLRVVAILTPEGRLIRPQTRARAPDRLH